MLTKSLEDYLETIKILTDAGRIVRVKEISKFLRVTEPSVVNALNILKEKGYIEQEKYGHVELTELGDKEARKILKKHKIVFGFLTNILNVSPKVAQNDACRMEHVISDETIEKILKFQGDYKK
ncbi:MAG TPA: metal-dependent transcriptional regulator [bacterium]|nr:metal-dependent transcriptional regulator [bacterium]HOL34511.1 metal-dependent transcriptional regulator [bacterium]HPP08075.1 metal-dependent transcriptional regulator [bacterium]